MKNKFLAYFFACAIAFSAMGVMTAAEDVTEAVSEAEAGEAAAEELSDDIYSFQVKLDGELYSFPMSFADFTARGWECDESDAAMEVQPNTYGTVTFRKGYLAIYADVLNLGINTSPASECSIGGFSLDEYQYEKAPETTLELPGGIVYGQSSLDDITAAYGTPSDTYESDLYTKVSYEYDFYQDVELYVSAETGFLNEVDLRNFVADDEANAAAAAEVNDEPTEAVLAYEAPAELGDDPLSFIVEFAGDLYQLPAPVSSFVENGWTIKPDNSESIVSGGDSGWVTMMKDNQEFRTLAKNVDKNATVIENCFIRDVEANVNDCNVSLTVPSGITIGMSKDELLSVLDSLEGIKYEENTETSEMFTYYNILGQKGNSQYIQILVYNDENAVTGIDVENN